MGYNHAIKIGNTIGILTDDLDIRMILRSITSGSNRQLTGQLEVYGSPIIPNGTLVDIAQNSPVAVSSDIRVVVANRSRSTLRRLPLYIDKPREYRVYYIKSTGD